MKHLLLKSINNHPAPQKNRRAYILRVSRQFSTEGSLLLFGGLCEKEKSFLSITEEANKAFRAGYSYILLPWNFVFHPEKQKLAEWAALNPLHFILAVHKHSFKSFQQLFYKLKKTNFYLELNLESYDSSLLQELESSPYSFYITIPAHKKVNLEVLSQKLNERYKKTREEFPNNKEHWKHFVLKYKSLLFKKNDRKLFSNNKRFAKAQKISKDVFVHFPCSHTSHPALYNSKEIYAFLQKSYYPPPPYDIYNLSIPKDLKLEPENKAEIVYNLKKDAWPFYKLPHSFKSILQFAKIKNSQKKTAQPLSNSLPKTNQYTMLTGGRISKAFGCNQTLKKSSWPRIKASVIIAAYNCERELILTLEHLHQQDFPKKEWELIVADDGSEKKLSHSLKKLEFLKKMNFKLFFLPREFPRTGPKDHRFRAGIARNLGAKYAKGENLLFLDADILIPPHYISSACQLLQKHDIIQHPRYHLKESAPCSYKEINKEKHTFIKINSYWENFYKTAENWNKKSCPWKYISSNTLALKTKIFKQMLGFKKNYTCWGFEDTDLGYRLYKAGFKFKLNPIDTYHLFRPTEFADSTVLRRELLGISALTFFHNNHDLSSYQEFSHLYQN